MPKEKLPSWGNVKEGFSPSARYQDTVDGEKSLGNAFSKQGRRDGIKNRAAPRSAGTLDPDLAGTAAGAEGAHGTVTSLYDGGTR